MEYFVSYYDYYQPEAYVPSTDTYIEKDSSINDEIDELRHAATSALLSRDDVIVVASVSCIYGIGEVEDYRDKMLTINVGDEISREDVLKKSLEKRINTLGHIPVTLQGPYYGLWDSADFQSVNVNDIIGYVKSLDDIHDTGIYVHLKDTLEPKNITKIIDRVTEGYQLGLRYIAEIETNESEDNKNNETSNENQENNSTNNAENSQTE